ncbi:MAG: hypothetical protein K2X43_00460 [Hyphomonadaceae bacterium]|nr:hypothetical protein [Hyphomonadaceae bacterium]
MSQPVGGHLAREIEDPAQLQRVDDGSAVLRIGQCLTRRSARRGATLAVHSMLGCAGGFVVVGQKITFFGHDLPRAAIDIAATCPVHAAAQAGAESSMFVLACQRHRSSSIMYFASKVQIC